MSKIKQTLIINDFMVFADKSIITRNLKYSHNGDSISIVIQKVLEENKVSFKSSSRLKTVANTSLLWIFLISKMLKRLGMRK